MILFLIGYRGSGKSTIAPLLAAELVHGCVWVDLDRLIEDRSSRAIPDIFENSGESIFRDIETECLEFAVSQYQNDDGKNDRNAICHAVIATGGGIVERQENLSLIKQGWTVFLSGSAETLLQRIQKDHKTGIQRPRLSDLPQEEEVRDILIRRTDRYLSWSDLIVEIDDRTPQEIVEEIVMGWKQRFSKL